MRLKIAIACLILSAPCLAQDGQQIIAMDAEDAETCLSGCAMITKAALANIKQQLERAEKVEALAIRQAAELAKKPDPKFCL